MATFAKILMTVTIFTSVITSITLFPLLYQNQSITYISKSKTSLDIMIDSTPLTTSDSFSHEISEGCWNESTQVYRYNIVIKF